MSGKKSLIQSNSSQKDLSLSKVQCFATSKQRFSPISILPPCNLITWPEIPQARYLSALRLSLKLKSAKNQETFILRKPALMDLASLSRSDMIESEISRWAVEDYNTHSPMIRCKQFS